METLRILWFNWRCIRHPLAGGAEVYTHEIARRLAALGHEITLITSRPPGLPPRETIDGYQVIRTGNKYTLYPRARSAYHQLKTQGWKPDLIIDEVNTIPFLTPLYATEPLVMLIHQLCKDCWKHAIHLLAQPPGWLLEKTLHQPYIKATKTGHLKAIITVSQSTREDLQQLGYPPERIHIVPNAIDWNLYKHCADRSLSKKDIVTYLGRISRYKKLEDLLYAWRHVVKNNENALLIIAGRPDINYLKRIIKIKNKIKVKNIIFKFNISQEEKISILSASKVLVYPSIREGYGQTVMEAAVCKTPSIAYNVPGLRDSIIHLKTGILVRSGNIKELSFSISALLRNDRLRQWLSNNAYNKYKKLNWDFSSSLLNKIIVSSLL